jgi:hypothetical protein
LRQIGSVWFFVNGDFNVADGVRNGTPVEEKKGRVLISDQKVNFIF